MIFALLEYELKTGQHARIQKPLAPHSVLQDGGALSLVEVERSAEACGRLGVTMPQGREITLVTGKLPGQTSLIVWQQGGSRMVYDLTVRMSPLRLVHRPRP